MKLVFISVKSGSSNWSEKALEEYEKKISGFCAFEVLEIKSPSAARNKSNTKASVESRKILSKIMPNDFFIVFDESGRPPKNSVAFANQIQGWMELGKSRLVFLIGGAYGTSAEVKDRANALVSFSTLTMNHHVAKAVALEQIYRAFTILRGIPYHNS